MTPTDDNGESELRRIYEDACKQLERNAFRYGSKLSNGVKHGVNISDIKTVLRSVIKKAGNWHHQQLEAKTTPSVDLNNPKYFLQNVESLEDAFNLFIEKWCLHAAHLLDSDDNDGEYMRRLIEAKIAEAELETAKTILQDAALEHKKRRPPESIAVPAIDKAIAAGRVTCPNGHILAPNDRCLDKKCKHRTGVRR